MSTQTCKEDLTNPNCKTLSTIDRSPVRVKRKIQLVKYAATSTSDLRYLGTIDENDEFDNREILDKGDTINKYSGDTLTKYPGETLAKYIDLQAINSDYTETCTDQLNHTGSIPISHERCIDPMMQRINFHQSYSFGQTPPNSAERCEKILTPCLPRKEIVVAPNEEKINSQEKEGIGLNMSTTEWLCVHERVKEDALNSHPLRELDSNVSTGLFSPHLSKNLPNLNSLITTSSTCVNYSPNPFSTTAECPSLAENESLNKCWIQSGILFFLL